MPGFQKDYSAFPDSNGNQWARTGGLFGRNRASSAPTGAKKAPAVNKPGQASAVNFTLPTNTVQNSNQAYTSNPFVQKLSMAIQTPQRGLYMPGQGPVTSQVSSGQQIIPSPNFPQPTSPDPKGKFPSGPAMKAAVQRVLSFTEARSIVW